MIPFAKLVLEIRQTVILAKKTILGRYQIKLVYAKMAITNKGMKLFAKVLEILLTSINRMQ